MQARTRAAAEGHELIHEVRVLRCPLKCLAGAHAPPEDCTHMPDAETFCDEFVLGADVVVESDGGERMDGGVGRGRGLAVAEEGGEDDVVAFWREGLVAVHKPEIVGYQAGVPCWIYNCREGARTDSPVGDEGVREGAA